MPFERVALIFRAQFMWHSCYLLFMKRRFLPFLCNLTRHSCNLGLVGSMAWALLTDCSINNNLSAKGIQKYNTFQCNSKPIAGMTTSTSYLFYTVLYWQSRIGLKHWQFSFSTEGIANRYCSSFTLHPTASLTDAEVPRTGGNISSDLIR